MCQFRPKHFREQLRARLPVAVFPGERTAIADDQVGRLLHKLAEVDDALPGLEIEVDPHVQTGVSEMSVQGAAVTIALHQFAEIAQIAAELFRSNGGIFPTLPAGRLPRHVGDGSQSRFACCLSGNSRICGGFVLWLRVRMRLRAWDSASAAVFAPNSANSQPPPVGKRASPSGFR